MNRMIKFIECNGSPYDMGFQYGQQCRKQISHNLELQRENWENINIESFVATVMNIMNERLGDVYDELKGISDGADVDLKYLLLTNHVDTFGTFSDRCTPIALRTHKGQVIVAKNNDAPINEDYSFILRRCYPDDGIPFIQLTYAGWLSGMDMMNGKGLANTHGSIGSKFDKTGDRIDIRLQMYHLMKRCETVGELIAGLKSSSLTGKGFSIVAGDRQKNMAVIEAAVPLIETRNSNKEFIYSTNLYMTESLKFSDMRSAEARKICGYRYGYLDWVEQTAMPRNLDDIKNLLASHEPWGPCRHGGPHISRTLWSMINLTDENKVLVAPGPPCETEYQEYEL